MGNNDNNMNNIPREVSWDQAALNGVSTQGVQGYRPGMYQQLGQAQPSAPAAQPSQYQPGMYQPGMYQPGMYQQGGNPQPMNNQGSNKKGARTPNLNNQAYGNPYQAAYDEQMRLQQAQMEQERKRGERDAKREIKKQEKKRKKKEAADRRNDKPVNFIARLIGGILLLVQFVLAAITGFLTVKSKMLPPKYLIVALVVLVGLVILDYFLLKGGVPRKKFKAGMVMTIISCIGLAAVIYYVYGGISALEAITGYKVETTVYGVYVREEDPAQKMKDVKDYSFATCFTMESNKQDDIVDKVKKEIGKAPNTMDYPDMMSQIDSLLDGTNGACVMSETNFNTVADVEGYENIPSRVRKIGTFKITTLVKTATEKNITSSDTFVVFISGIDTEGDVSARSRSDVNIIAVINPSTHQILLVSTPRDYFVTLYGLPDGGSSPTRDKLTHAGNFGIDCSAATLGELYDVDVDYYFRCNFTGFRDIINALGGIDVYSDYNFSYGGHSFVQGLNENLDGDAALCFARERHAFADGDRQRGRNQMAVIEAVIHKMTSPAILRNYSDTMKGVEGSFATSMPYDLISGLVNDQLDNGGDWDVQKYSVTGSNSSSTTYSIPRQSVYVMEPDMATVEQARKYIKDMLDNKEIHVEQS